MINEYHPPSITPYPILIILASFLSWFRETPKKQHSPPPATQLRRLRPLALSIQTPYRTQSSPLGKGSDRGQQGSYKSFDPTQSPSNPRFPSTNPQNRPFLPISR